MSTRTRLALGLVLVVVGLVWFLQGVGVLGGSPMTGVTLWAVVGPALALVGLSLALSGRGGRGGRPPSA